MRYYIATRLEAAHRHRDLHNALAERGHQITYDWTAHGSVRHEGEERIRQVAHAEKQGVKDADFVVVLLPGGRGTHSELGLALASYKRVFIVADIAEGAWAPDERTCAFYHDDLVFRVEYNSQVLPWSEYVHNLANTIHAEVTRAPPVPLPGTPEPARAGQAAYVRALARRMFERWLRCAREKDPAWEKAARELGSRAFSWDRSPESERAAWEAAAAEAVSAIWSELHNAVDGAVTRTDSPLAPLTARVAAWRWREKVEEHFATTRRAGVAPQPPPVNADDRETWLLVVEDTETYLPGDAARDLLRADMRERNRLGKHRYGVALSPHNGRDSLVDAYQEALDKVVYLKNAVLEGRRVGIETDPVLEEYGEALLAAHRLRGLVGTRDRAGGAADGGL